MGFALELLRIRGQVGVGEFACEFADMIGDDRLQLMARTNPHVARRMPSFREEDEYIGIASE